MTRKKIPAVTVVLPTYDRAHYLRQAIRSALAQKFDDLIVSIGDNGPSSDAEKIVKEFDDPRIEYIKHPTNLGAQGNWLTLIERARTPLVATLHDDDVWHTDFLQRLVPPMLADSDLAMSFGDFDLIDGSGRRLSTATAELSAKTRRDRLQEGRIDADRDLALRLVAVWNAPNPAICAVLRRDAVLATEFPSEAVPLYDLWLSYQFLRSGAPVYYLRSRLTDYRLHSTSATSKGFSQAEDYIFERILDENAGAGPVLDEIRRYWAMIRWGRAMALMKHDASEDDATTDRAQLIERSRHEFRQAAPHQTIVRAAFARIAGSGNLGWSLLQRLIRCQTAMLGHPLRHSARSFTLLSRTRKENGLMR
ncbi:MAG: glycosyltransferase [Burkholderiaceae bacterium]